MKPSLHTTRPFTKLACFVAPALALSAMFVWLQCRNLPATHSNGRWLLPDPDDYMRLYRARMILDGQATIVRTIPALHLPEGVELHWTAPMDYFILAAVKVASFGKDPRLMLEPVGALVPVVLGVIYLASAMLVAWRALGATPALLIGLMIVISPGLHHAFRLGHCDHHGLIELLSMLAVYAWLPSIRRGPEPSPAAALLGGLAMGLAMWVAVEAVLVWLAVMAGTTFATFHASPERRALWRQRRSQWNGAALGVVALGWLVENAPHLGRITDDKVSLLHVLVFAAAFAIPAGRSPERHSSLRRWAFALIVLPALTWVLISSFSELTGTFRRPELGRWISQITEFQPLILRTSDDWSLVPLIRYLGLVPFVLPLLLWFFIRSKMLHCMAKLTLALLCIGMTALSIRQLRWSDHVTAAVAPICVIGLIELARRVLPDAQKSRAVGRAAFVLSLFALLIFPSAAGVLTPPSRKPDPYMTRAMRAVEAIQRHQAAEGAPSSASSIMCEYDAGPIFLYYTNLPVIAGPYHRGLDGLLEVARFFAERDAGAARAELDRRAVGYVVVPYRPAEQLRIMESITFGAPRSYEPPRQKIEYGELLESITPKPEIATTVAYRLAQCEGADALGLRAIEKIDEGANTPDGLSGLVFIRAVP